jgi:SAM-dependent methyltransferase
MHDRVTKGNNPTPLRCGLCESTGARCIAEENGYPIYRCLKCGLVFVYPIPDAGDMKDYYGRHEGACGDTVWEKFGAEIFEHAARTMRRCCPSGKLLDLGCGYGFFMKLMRERGWQVQGLEIDGEMARYARERLGLDVRQADVNDYASRGEEFDLISLWWVLEHLPDPMTALRKCVASLKREGMLILRVPNIDFIAFVHRFRFIEPLFSRLGLTLAPILNPVSRKKRFFELLGAPYHLYGYNRRTICTLLSKAGLGDCRVTLGGRLRTGKKFRDSLELLLYAVAATVFRLSLGRIIIYHDMTVCARKER